MIISFPVAEITEQIIGLRPDMVINDMLNTTDQYVKSLRDKNIKVVNFEDLGTGACCANLTINELYDEPQVDGHSILWGNAYCFLRDEFLGASPHQKMESITDILITFGGTDQNDFTLKTVRLIAAFCKENNIRINIVAGYGYLHEESMRRYIRESGFDHITYTRVSGVISKMMEKSQIAITSNGRTVYELAHMHVPSIVISQHEREKSHAFACEENGFVHLGEYANSENGQELLQVLGRIVHEHACRERLFSGIARHDFSRNKKKVVKKILDLLDEKIEKTRKKKIVGIIQARMGATRLPNKMMLHLQGRPIVEWVFRRVAKCRMLDDVVIALPDTPDNEILERYLTDMGAKVFKGSENDVVRRFYDAAVHHKATDIVRICADNPLISPQQVDALIRYYHENSCDYAYNHVPRNNTFPDGLGAEIVPFAILELIDREAKTPSQREHVFNYIWDNTGRFTIKTFDPSDAVIARPDLKLDIDTKDDYEHFLNKKIHIDMDDREIVRVFGGGV